MKRDLHRITLIAVIAIVGCQRVPTPAPAPARAPAPRPVPPPSSEPAAIRTFAELVNTHRKAIGCPLLAWDERIAAVAQAHSEDMVRNNYFDHTNPRGQNAFGRLDEAGVGFSAAAENIAYGQPTAQQVLASWLNSAGHRKNIDNCRYTRHGVGLAGTRWTHVFVGGR